MLLSSSNRKYQPYSLVSYFSVVLCLRCLLHHILSLIAYTYRVNRDLVFIIIVQLMMSSNSRMNLVDRIRLFVYNIISLSSLCKPIWRHWTYKMPVRYMLSSVWVSLSIFSQLSIIQYMGLCVFSLPIYLLMIERIYTLSYYHHQIGSMNYYPLFRVRSWNTGVRCMSLYVPMCMFTAMYVTLISIQPFKRPPMIFTKLFVRRWQCYLALLKVSTLKHNLSNYRSDVQILSASPHSGKSLLFIGGAPS